MLQVPADALAAIVARPETFLPTYRALGGSAGPDSYVRAALGAPFASLLDVGCVATFASAVAHDAAPAGTPTLDPLTATLHDLLTADALGASHFCKLSALLTLLANPGSIPPGAGAGNPPKATLHFLVWLDTVPLGSGAHTQLLVTNVLPNAYLLLDPLYAFALRIPFSGAGPQSGVGAAVNVATMMQTPIAPTNLVVLDPAATAAVPQVLPTVVSGAMGPQYLDTTPTAGCTFWDGQIGQIIDNLS